MSARQVLERARISATGLADHVARRVSDGTRFAGLFASATTEGTMLTAVLAGGQDLEIIESLLDKGITSYPAVTPPVPAAGWYEREIHDLFGITAQGHPHLTPLVLPLEDSEALRPRPGASQPVPTIRPDEHALPSHVVGEGLFTIPFGPVRSGVFETIEYLIETSGEEILHVWVRPYYKHRGIEKRFERLSPADGALLAERVEGIASVAHAIAFCEAVEKIAGVGAPFSARLVRTLYAELERIANHVDVAMRLTEAAGLAVATARLGWHKERAQRLTGSMCGNRFGRGVVIPGGVTARPALAPQEVHSALDGLASHLQEDAGAMMETESFLDRLWGTGHLERDDVELFGALGPIGRATGLAEDVRVARPYAAYERLIPRVAVGAKGDALARLEVRWEEMWESFALAKRAVDDLQHAGKALAAPLPSVSGEAIGWAEAPQGEVLYLVAVEHDRIVRCKPRSASFHNLPLFARAFKGDILTDFAFIEASFGLSAAGVAL